MLSSAAKRIEPQRALGNRGITDSLPPGLALTQIISGVMENWDEIERQMPWSVVPLRGPRVETNSGHQAPRFDRGPLTKEENTQNPQSNPNSPTALAEGEEGLLGKQAPVAAVKKPEIANTEKPAATAEKGAEVSTQASLNFRAPEMPKVEGQAMPASFAVPNHSAGASGFGSTWSHAAAKQGNDNIILSE